MHLKDGLERIMSPKIKNKKMLLEMDEILSHRASQVIPPGKKQVTFDA